MPHIIILCLLIQLFLPCHAQQLDVEEDNVLSYMRKTLKGHAAPGQEKAYLHFDNNCYRQGDTIWYKAYVVNAQDNTPRTQSRILHVELLNEQGYVVERQQLVINPSGQCHGQFALPDTAWAGYYEVRAYTNWMRNVRETADAISPMFSRVLPVYEKESATASYLNRNMPHKRTLNDYEIIYPRPPFNVGIYPEGGHMVYGLQSRVAFETSNEQTMRMAAKGHLMEDDHVMCNVESNIDGRGSFVFTPRMGHKYRLRFQHSGKTYDTPIDRIDDTGYVMAVSQGEGRLWVDVRTSPSSANTPRMFVSLSCRGRCLEVFDASSPISCDMSTLPSGVMDITLFDTSGNVCANRMTFVDNIQRDRISIRIDGKQTSCSPYERMHLTLIPDSAVGNTTYSVSICDRQQMADTYMHGNILTELLLQSDVKGAIELVDKYLADKDALDLMLMTQGWSRYEWKHMLSAPPTYRFCHERSLGVSGVIRDIQKDQIWRKTDGRLMIFADLYLKDSETYAVDLGENTYRFTGGMYADSLCRFRFEFAPFYGDATLQLSSFYENKINNPKYSRQLHDTHLFIRRDNPNEFYARGYSWYEMHDYDPSLYRRRHEGRFDLSGNNLLDEVVVKSRNAFRTDLNHPVAKYDFIDFLNETFDQDGLFLTRFKFDNMEYTRIMFDIAARKFMYGTYQPYKGYWINWYGVKMDDIVPDLEHELDQTLVRRYSFIHRMDKIEFVTDNPRRPSYFQLSHPLTTKVGLKTSQAYAIEGIIKYKLLPEGEEKFYYGRHINFHGFDKPAEFYHPKYEGRPLPEKPDYRHTLYWNPNVISDSDGSARVSFYNNSVCTDLYIEVAGVTSDGRVLINE